MSVRKKLLIVFSITLILGLIFVFTSNQGKEKKEDEDANCGPIALKIVCQIYGVKTTVEELARLAQTDEEGTTMYGLFQAARAKGLRAAGTRLDFEDLKRIEKPVIVFLKKRKHYVVVMNVTEKGVIIKDKDGKYKMIKERRFKRLWDSQVLVVRKR
jgi:predicted double-glycine peptidase